MRTLVRSVGRSDIGGEPLPTCFKTFDSNKIIFRRAEVSMLAGVPGVGKSTLALALALRMHLSLIHI
jgi:predicted ATPase